MVSKLQKTRPMQRGQCTIGISFACVLSLCMRVEAQSAPEPVLRVDLLDNGTGAELSAAPEGDERRMLLPWWISSGTQRGVPPTGAAVEIAPGATLTQPVAAYAPLASTLVISGRVAGHGRVCLVDGQGQKQIIDVRDQEFLLPAKQSGPKTEITSLPRFTLELSSTAGSSGAGFHDLHAFVDLPCPSEAALARELRELCDGVFRTWLERGADRDGARKTSFLTRRFDAVTGEMQPGREASGLNAFFESLLDATSACDDDFWRASLEAYLNDFFELTFHPTTGMPRDWDGEQDLPQDAKPVEVGRYLAFLLDLSERGPAAFRARALKQAEFMAETILAHGRLPDGALAVKYVPADGSPRLDAQSIRQLDVAAQLARLSHKNGDARLVDAARSALNQLEYVHFWGGTWNAIDPDFDDSYGNWGSKATTMLAAFPEDPLFRNFCARGFEHFAPLWRDALRFGGSTAADQKRCWEFLLRYGQIETSATAQVGLLLRRLSLALQERAIREWSVGRRDLRELFAAGRLERRGLSRLSRQPAGGTGDDVPTGEPATQRRDPRHVHRGTALVARALRSQIRLAHHARRSKGEERGGRGNSFARRRYRNAEKSCAMNEREVLAEIELRGNLASLRPPRVEHAEHTFGLIAGRRELLEWIDWPGPESVEAMREQARHWRTESDTAANYQLAILCPPREASATEEVVGAMSIRFIDHPERADLGYWIGVEHQGRGLASEAVGLALWLAFELLEANSASACVFENNLASRRVLEKHGFTLREAHDSEAACDPRPRWFLLLERATWSASAAALRPRSFHFAFTGARP